MDRTRFVILDIDGLRPDVFRDALQRDRLPNFERLLGPAGRRLVIPALAVAPSATFASQASLFTGAHPAQHGVLGNQFFDRFGLHSGGVPRHYAFNIGDTWAVDDAVRVFTDGLAARCLQAPTLYEQLAPRGYRSVVVGHMYATGAAAWLKPSLINLARLTKGGSWFGMSPADFDRSSLDQALDYLDQHGLPDILTIHFLGIDGLSHAHGPTAQAGYLVEAIEPMMGALVEAVEQAAGSSVLPLFSVVSDHGHKAVVADDRHSLRLAFPFERELGHLFDAFGLDVHDLPAEDPHSDAVVCMNGGMAHVYLRRRQQEWQDPPEFMRDIQPVAQAFWREHQSGTHVPDLEGALAGVLVRNVEYGGWRTPYLALLPDGRQITLEEWFRRQPPEEYADPVNRIENMASPLSGDILLLSNYRDGFQFGGPSMGTHGGLHPDDSASVMVFGWPGVSKSKWQQARRKIATAIEERCQAEGNRQPSTADLASGLLALASP